MAAGYFLFFLWGYFNQHACSEENRQDSHFRIAVFTPTTEGNTYWPEVQEVMQTAARDLGIELMFHEFDIRDRFAKSSWGVEILHTAPLADAAIFSVAIGQAQPLMDAAEQLNIPFFLNGPLFPSELVKLGGTPRNTYRNWIGYFHEDEEEKGYLLARILIQRAIKSKGTDRYETINIAGIGGDATWYGSVLRERGLRRAIEEHPEARLLQTVPSKWTEQEGRDLTIRLFQRYGSLDVIWCASDQLSLGAIQALQSADVNPGAEVYTGGLDLSLTGLEAIRQGTMFASVAASPLIWAKIVIYLYDYLKGIDFAGWTGTEIIFPPEIADSSSAPKLLQLHKEYNRINFRKHSRFSGDKNPANEFLLPGSNRCHP